MSKKLLASSYWLLATARATAKPTPKSYLNRWFTLKGADPNGLVAGIVGRVLQRHVRKR